MNEHRGIEQTNREATRRMVAGLLAQRKLGFFDRLAARAQWRLGRWNDYWMSLSRRGRRALARRLAPALLGASLLAGLVMIPQPAAGAVDSITVVDGEVLIDPNGLCSLPEAVENANDGDQTHADCAAGTAGTDTIVLPTGGDFLFVYDFNYINGDASLPAITSGIIIEGNGSTLRRDPYYSSAARHILMYGNTDLTLNQVTLSGGRVTDSSGGAIYSVDAPPFVGYYNRSLTINDSTLTGNYAYYDGGAINFRGSDYGVSSLIIHNTTISGNASENAGGIYFTDGYAELTVSITDSTITNNDRGGIRGGLYDFVPPYAPVSITISRSIISGNIFGAEVKLLLYHPGASVATDHNVFGHDGLTTSDALYGFLPGVTDVTATSDGTDPTALAAILDPLADNGGPTMTHALPTGSPALDIAPSGPAADQRGEPRPSGAAFDAGAFELQVPAVDPTLYVNGLTSGNVDGIPFDNRDILAFDTGSETWAMHFDGSDAGVTRKLSSFTILDDDSIVMSFHAKQSGLPGLSGSAMPHDLVRFVPTTGMFAWYLDGSDVGLTKASERIDAADVLPDGRVLLSTVGDAQVGPGNGVKAEKEDLLALTPSSLGTSSAGTWALYFNGSAVPGLDKENVTGAAVDAATGDVYLALESNFTAGGLSGGPKDVLRLEPDGGGGYTVSLFWNGPANGFMPKVRGIEVE